MRPTPALETGEFEFSGLGRWGGEGKESDGEKGSKRGWDGVDWNEKEWEEGGG